MQDISARCRKGFAHACTYTHADSMFITCTLPQVSVRLDPLQRLSPPRGIPTLRWPSWAITNQWVKQSKNIHTYIQITHTDHAYWSYIHTYIHTYILTYMHTVTYIHTCLPAKKSYESWLGISVVNWAPDNDICDEAFVPNVPTYTECKHNIHKLLVPISTRPRVCRNRVEWYRHTTSSCLTIPRGLRVSRLWYYCCLNLRISYRYCER